MAILGFNYTKLHAEKTKPVTGKVSINNNVSLTNAEKSDVSLKGDKKAIKVSFKYGSNYEPEVGKLEIEGTLMYFSDKHDSEELLKHWKDNKALPKPVMTDIINYVLSKCNVEAIILSRDINIPSPIPMPKVAKDK